MQNQKFVSIFAVSHFDGLCVMLFCLIRLQSVWEDPLHFYLLLRITTLESFIIPFII